MNFLSPDPLAEKYANITPYSYCGVDPVNMVDPTGMDVDGYYFSGADAQWVFRYLQSQLASSGTGVTIKQLCIFAGETGGGVHITDDMFLGFMGNIIRNMGGSGAYRYFKTPDAILAIPYSSMTNGSVLYITPELLIDQVKAYAESNSAKTGGGNSLSDSWGWMKKHFYIGLEDEISHGVQLSVFVNKGVGLNLDLASQVVSEWKLSNRGSYCRSYPLQPFAYADKGKAMDFGIAWVVGGNYNWNLENSKEATQTFSVGLYGFGGNITWGESGVSNIFIGWELGGKAALGWGASGSFKIGFTWDY